jgi:HD-GYP domain-containing protein (c-di-GMP phosphodiesterase class II)
MSDSQTQIIDISQLRTGMYIHLDLGWMDHPFPMNSFILRSQEQIDILRSLGLERVRFSPGKSDPGIFQAYGQENAPTQAATEEESPEMVTRRLRRDLLSSQWASLQACERKYADASRGYREAIETVHSRPTVSREQSENMIRGFLREIMGEQEACIRLLSENAGEKSSLHPINVTVISLLLGKASGLGEQDLLDVGMGALLHDVGKIELPNRLRWSDEQFTASERALYQEHVAHGVTLGRKMGLSKDALLVIGQHHELADGKGYPRHITDKQMSLPSRIVALVNLYDNLCNPGNPALAITPHEALALIFALRKSQFHAATLSLFVRMMGVYPPGSVVQLTDERFAMVVSVNSCRPLKPRIVIHDANIPRDEALVIDLEDEPNLGIRRSLKPLQLPKSTFDYLSPRKRICYFFERAREVSTPAENA